MIEPAIAFPAEMLLCYAQFGCAPANAHVENRAIAHFVSHARGGEGAVRDLCDLILTVQGHYARYLEAALQA
jgi:3-deoxy-D-manno-octulosonate 8-phosphate phosphatase (KDO 8-P phosphatase)